MNKLKQLIAEVRFGETEADRSHAYKEALLMVDLNERLLRREGLTRYNFKRIIEGLGKLSVHTPDFGNLTMVETINRGFFDRDTVAIIDETDEFKIHLLDKKALKCMGFNQSEIDDICGVVFEYAATMIEKRKETE